MTDEFDYIAYARKQLADLTPEGRDWGSYPADIDDWNGHAQCVTDTFCFGTEHPCPEGAHTCARDLVRVGFEKCDDCYFPGEYAQLLAAVPATFRALLAEIDRQAALLERNHRAYLTMKGIDPDSPEAQAVKSQVVKPVDGEL